ncbi:hypothetical protein ACOQFV_27505 [Nocardiopsis changdeensis]|uniref:XRE family transcriptional regulator n=1 Tax=Nocardiopsis changdeensis TaxID=2831969 RepID=A0ABX8BN44_9ACTN|nr:MULTISPECIES: hypothetical protein [Nocardiopsis]QUX23013.1 hypothetical protein KGD84_00960 [Nocardiopsis changdeensis]QYX38958.1 hypothetical protein K1J57_10415 [Nocardiopsis sp. MT53]
MASPYAPSPERLRLGRLIDQRKRRKSWTWTEIAARGIPLETLRRARLGTAPLTKETLERLDHTLQWEPGSAQTVLNGGNPVPLEGPTVEQEQRVLSTPLGEAAYTVIREIEEDSEDLDPEEREELEAALAERLRTEMTLFANMKRAELERRRGRRARSGDEG